MEDLTHSGIWIVHVPAPVQILRALEGSGGRIMACRLESPRAPDFLGVMGEGGRAVALEVKTAPVGGRSWPLPERLRAHQGEALAAVARRGGLAAVLIRREDGARYCVPWPEGDPRGEDGTGRVSWVWEELEGRGWRLGVAEAWGARLSGMEVG